ncbi:predicted protein [Lichtheimia corymbifera JMRC:FSU:9682]|uniref:Uncharacterized protein n=1 Tax=Lichtheimia corymbifera JMRC:FSU:9682 TaxID=1263082 RepID=A0A068S4D8_9FUNG|nr:predicted protein [Lichtheimia corymbifera JMRC:FSU:9682]
MHLQNNIPTFSSLHFWRTLRTPKLASKRRVVKEKDCCRDGCLSFITFILVRTISIVVNNTGWCPHTVSKTKARSV